MNKIELDIQQANNYYSYSEFKQMVSELYNQGLNTGPNQLEVLMNSTKMSLQRMKKWDKIYKTSPLTEASFKNISDSWTWYVITEGWCGDASQIIPVIAKLASLSDKIELKILLRDENPKIMNNYLTNGGMAIPIMVAVNNGTGFSTPHFGPRPTAIQERVEEYKIANPNFDKSALNKELHLWYAKDKGVSTQLNILKLVNDYMVIENAQLHMVI